MEITQIYTRFRIPKNLQLHHFRVAAVGKYLCDHWDSAIDKKSVIETLLLHDLGNLLKFDLNRGIMLLDQSERDLNYWKKIQQDMKSQYGDDEHVATYKMAQEIVASPRVLDILSRMGSSNLEKTIQSSDTEVKICSYADMRVSPDGFVTVEERFADILRRYAHRNHVLADEQKTLFKKELCLQLEKQIQANCDTDVVVFSEKEAQEILKTLRNYSFSL